VASRSLFSLLEQNLVVIGQLQEEKAARLRSESQGVIGMACPKSRSWLLSSVLVLISCALMGCSSSGTTSGTATSPTDISSLIGTTLGTTLTNGTGLSIPGLSGVSLEPSSLATEVAGLFPASISGTGASGDVPPVSSLPAPAEAQSKIQELVSAFGLKSISGSGATVDVLNRMQDAYRRFPSGSFKNLSVTVESQTDQGSTGSSGVWTGTDQNGNEIQNGGATVGGGKIVYYGASSGLDTWLLVHEVAHHVSIYVDPSFGVKTLQTLGYQSSNGQSSDLVDVMNEKDFQAVQVPRNSYPTQYSRTAAQEHLAELMSLQLCGTAPSYDAVSNFQWPAPVQSQVDAKL